MARGHHLSLPLFFAVAAAAAASVSPDSVPPSHLFRQNPDPDEFTKFRRICKPWLQYSNMFQ
jgi:hypothetical protein